MKLHRLDRSSISNSSLTTKVNEYPYFLKIWHYHAELELVVILKSEGTCFIGDSIEKFNVGDVILIGKNLPHMWVNSEDYFNQNATELVKAIAIHFKQNYLGDSFFEASEMKHILALFERAKYGIKFLNVDTSLINEIKKMLDLEGFNKTISFLIILNKLAKHTSTKNLASDGFVNSFQSTKSDIQDKVQAYIFKNFNKEINLETAASIANMNTAAFSRYFKRVNKKTFSRYVTEIRIGYACKMLMEDKFNIAGICYESGFKNISNFNRQFKIVMNSTPSNYLKKYKAKISEQ
ncbi:AraC family transcriptional regulator [Polaribacter undariae]|uniref:AraC family transcriptional regulator n=1 Tax=Polaribacter sejongensis TaxID=985043 RepID=A0AAJ1QWE3_9FLAO|nr:AraC family transcriptional regulator [Polaribacter undariae]MDN3619416.1 AraC family transcriptional regulator [Polaribacter undariae]UWD33384.1 AraC family transcriptional regulator [Polaribacter undariae]